MWNKGCDYIINPDEYSNIATPHWVTWYVNKASQKDVQNNDVTDFDSFAVEHISK